MSTNREVMERYWAAAEANDAETMHALRDESFTVDFPQTGERLTGRDAIRAFEEAQPAGGSFELTALDGDGDVWTAQGVMRSGDVTTYIVSITRLRNGRLARSFEYFAGWLPPLIGNP
jgi:ketosteroid isomerase-like protein